MGACSAAERWGQSDFRATLDQIENYHVVPELEAAVCGTKTAVRAVL